MMFSILYMSDIDQNFVSVAQLMKGALKSFQNNQWLIKGKKKEKKCIYDTRDSSIFVLMDCYALVKGVIILEDKRVAYVAC